MVKPERLLEFATFLRDELGYDYLSSVTAVDYLAEGKLEVVYHAFKLHRRAGFGASKSQPRATIAVVPSLYPVYPGADLQEREVYDLMGIRFDRSP